MCAGPVRTGGGAPTNEAGTTPYGRSTRLGCECVPDRFAPGGPAIRRCSYRQACPPRVVGAPSGRECVMGRFAPGAVPLQMMRAPPLTVGGPAPGANVCPPGAHRGGAPTNEPGRRGLFGAGPGGGAAEHGGADEAAELEYVVSFQGNAALVGLAAFRVVDAAVLPGFAIAAGLHVPEDAQAFQRAVAQGFVRIFFVALGLAFSIQGVGDPHQVAAEL